MYYKIKKKQKTKELSVYEWKNYHVVLKLYLLSGSIIPLSAFVKEVYKFVLE